MSVNAIPADPIAGIHARIATVEGRFGVRRPQAAATASSGPVDFDALLAELTASAGTGGRAPAAVSPFSGFSGFAGLAGTPDPSSGARLSELIGTGAGAQVVTQALDQLGTPYVWGGASPGGFDCSGLVQHTYRQLGVELPRTSAEQARVGRPVASLADARPGDLVAFNSPVDHIGIYAGNGCMVVAPKRGDVVKVQPIYTQPTAIRRVLPDSVGGM